MELLIKITFTNEKPIIFYKKRGPEMQNDVRGCIKDEGPDF
jgi:hypothetical protein